MTHRKNKKGKGRTKVEKERDLLMGWGRHIQKVRL